MSEKDEAIALANRVLDRINADPDDDLAVLARQFLRASERVNSMQAAAAEQANDEGLWFSAVYASEAYLQQELRRLHTVIEGAVFIPKVSP